MTNISKSSVYKWNHMYIELRSFVCVFIFTQNNTYANENQIKLQFIKRKFETISQTIPIFMYSNFSQTNWKMFDEFTYFILVQLYFITCMFSTYSYKTQYCYGTCAFLLQVNVICLLLYCFIWCWYGRFCMCSRMANRGKHHCMKLKLKITSWSIFNSTWTHFANKTHIKNSIRLVIFLA